MHTSSKQCTWQYSTVQYMHTSAVGVSDMHRINVHVQYHWHNATATAGSTRSLA
jgi:hypothetical protein